MIKKIKTIPHSISETYYLGGGTWFIISLFLSAFLICAGLLEITDGSMWLVISFLTGAGIALVGASPKFKEGLDRKIHYIGAVTLMIGSLLWLLIYSNPYVFILWVPSVYWIFTLYRLFWCEITCILSMILGLLFI